MKIGNIEFKEVPIILAPMEDVSDAPFRHLCKLNGADLMFTEFISSEGLIRYADKSMEKMDFDESERPIGIQVFGHDPLSMQKAVEIAETFKPDIIDINFGCPVNKVVNKGAGAAVLKDLPRMIELTTRVVQTTSLPVTVKTRLGWDQHSINIMEVAERLQDVGIQAISIHARTRSQFSEGEADWSWIGKVKANPRIHIPVFGNGDIDNPVMAKSMIDTFGVDGIMVGRACVGNPFIFREIKHYLRHGEFLPPPSLEEKVAVCLEHIRTSVIVKGEIQGIREMRRHYSGYFKGLHGFKHYRMKIVTIDTLEELLPLIEEIRLHYAGDPLPE